METNYDLYSSICLIVYSILLIYFSFIFGWFGILSATIFYIIFSILLYKLIKNKLKNYPYDIWVKRKLKNYGKFKWFNFNLS